MFYVLFTYSKGQKEKDFRRFRSEEELIEFLHKDYEKIDIVQIIEAEKSYKLGLIETEDLIKSALIQTEEEAINNLKETLETDLPSPEEKKASMEKIADDIEKEMTEEEIIKKNEELFKRADAAIAVAKKDLKKTGQKFDKTKWEDCPICHKEKVAPWSKKGICSTCQRNKKKLRKKEEEI